MDEGPEDENATAAESSLLQLRRATARTTAPEGEITYRINPSAKSITCLVCSRESFHPEDIRHGYCAYCDMFHVLA
jgi:hypothetical protein